MVTAGTRAAGMQQKDLARKGEPAKAGMYCLRVFWSYLREQGYPPPVPLPWSLLVALQPSFGICVLQTFKIYWIC